MYWNLELPISLEVHLRTNFLFLLQKKKKVLEFEVEFLEIRVGVSEGGRGVNGIRVMLDICRHHGYD